MDKVCFVILHYISFKDTVECINTIIGNIKYNNYNIIIIDNKSPNNSGNLLKKKYKDDNIIKVILNNHNLGFANGNNIGYEYARNVLKADYIIFLNNDTIIKQSEFLNKVINIYHETRYYVLGPDIISLKNNLHQNPQRLKGLKKYEVKKLISFFRLIYIKDTLLYITKSYDFMRKLKKILKKMLHKENKTNNVNYVDNNLIQENVQLHGACLIFSPLYIEKFEYGLYPETFMYMEEDILYYLCRKNNFKTLYDPNIVIYHKEDASTDAFLNSTLQKRRFISKNSIKSAKVLYKLMKKEF